jgi:hypothetical protein
MPKTEEKDVAASQPISVRAASVSMLFLAAAPVNTNVLGRYN